MSTQTVSSTLLQQPHYALSVRELIARGGVETHFQPITSLRRKKIIGVEALSRGVDSDGRLIAPNDLFERAQNEQLSAELDEACCRAALKNFLPLHGFDPELILFINVHAATLKTDAKPETSVRILIDTVAGVGLDPRNIALEILESEFADVTRLKEMVALFKAAGFLVALDDVGAGHSNLDRITYIEPDILKADRALISGIEKNYCKQQVFKSLVNLSEKIGGWIVTEGIERQEEAIVALDLGADMLQGFYFARPHKPVSGSKMTYDRGRLEETALKFKSFTIDKLNRTHAEHAARATTTNLIVAELQEEPTETLEPTLAKLLTSHPSVQSVCLLNLDGVQTTDTLRNPHRDQKQKTIIFRPPTKDTDHSLKEYFYALLETSRDTFETNPYVPLPTGELCITVSTKFKDADGVWHVLCLHTNAAQSNLQGNTPSGGAS